MRIEIAVRALAAVLCLSGVGPVIEARLLRAQAGPAASATTVDLNVFRWRNVGPFRGGRASAVAGIPGDPLTFYMGTAGGGIFKTINGGITWMNVSDGFVKSPSVGALAVAPSNPNVIYAGMGEATARANTVHHGDGVYKSTDAGKTWRHMGLAPTQVISRIRVHPQNPDIVYVAAQGALYGGTQDRGVYRSTDGGNTWKRVLFVGETGGVSDLAMDARNPETLYAAIWDHQRFPWEIKSAGPLSGIHKSSDGGETWQRLTNGLPPTMGKVSVATTPDPNRVYALMSAQPASAAGLYRSDDAGATWTLINTTRGLVDRPWYYIKIVADPTNRDAVWVLSSNMYKSTDGGRNFAPAQSPHADRHDLWINPSNAKVIAIADDGGAAVSQDGGASWSTQNNQATSQIYRVITDNRFPYWLYGAQQDNSTIAIPSASSERGGMETEWTTVAGYENSFIALDPDRPDLTYATQILGELEEQSQSTRVSRNIQPYAVLLWGNLRSKYLKYRYVLNTPVFMSRFEPKTLYVGANKLLASDDRGQTWREVSPDVTLRGSDPAREQRLLGTGEVGEGAYGAITYAAESPQRKGVLWTASDDGLVGVTQDGGKTWHKSPLPGLTEARINTIEPSPHNVAVAYAAANRFQFNEYTPYFFKTSDFGRTWTRIGANLPQGGWARVVREDPVRRGLLYAGTEHGVFVSLDDGATWHSLQNNLPVPPIYDLVVHPRGDLVVATGGRAFWILDDVSALRELDAGLRETAVRLFKPRPAYRSNLAGGGGFGGGGDAGATAGQNPPTGALLSIYSPRAGRASIEIRNAAGSVVRRLGAADESNPSGAGVDLRAGLNRITWDLRTAVIPTVAAGGGPGQGRIEGHLVAPGTYTVRLTFDGTTATAPLDVRAMPSVTATAADYAAQEQLLTAIEKDLLEYRAVSRQIDGVRTQVAEAMRQLTDSGALDAARRYNAKLEMPAEIARHLSYLQPRVNGVVPAVRASYRETYTMLHADWLAQRAVLERALGADLDALNAVLARFNRPAIKPAAAPDRRP
jgi:photosystem II stability/assembly factor-like uncharacterized protein